ncbi:MAG: DUF3737 family protein [Spirochaetales bacterium]|nr:DUF3737 family protein [Spirochaetales bacterium]
MEKEKLSNQRFAGERALFQRKNLFVEYSVFEDGESPVKECNDITISNSQFKWKYPIWYSDKIELNSCLMDKMCRAAIWYCKDIVIKDTIINAPKTIRRSNNLDFANVSFFEGPETLWFCENVKLKDVFVKGDYFAMNSKNIEVDNLELVGQYSFDGVENVTIRNSCLKTKDAFWNSKNVTVYDSFIGGEYLGWNAENLTLINCRIESLQGLCYVKNLVMKNCKLTNTTLAFEYSELDAEICGRVDSIINPKSGVIKADSIGDLIIESDKINPDDTKIICPSIDRHLDKPEY